MFNFLTGITWFGKAYAFYKPLRGLMMEPW